MVGRHDSRAALRPAARRSRRRRWPRAPRGAGSASGGPKATWRRLRHSTLSHPRAWSTSWVAIITARPSAPSSASSASRRSALGPSRPVNGSSSRITRASCTSARATSTRWRWPPERSPNVAWACSASPTAASAARAARRCARPGRRHHGSVEIEPMRATSSALTGKSSRERSVCGTTPKRAGARSVPAMGASSPRRTRKSVVLPPPFGPRTPMRSPACRANDTSVSTGAAP